MTGRSTKAHFSAPPEEELRKDVVTANLFTEEEMQPWDKYRKLGKVLRIYAHILVAAKKWKSWKRPQRIVRGELTPPPPEFVTAAENLLIHEAQKEVDVEKLSSCLPETILTDDIYGIPRKIIMVGGRAKDCYRVGYDRPGIPVLPAQHPLSDLYLLEAHEIDHGGIDAAVCRSRHKVWIISAARSAKRLKNACIKCRQIGRAHV